MTDAGRPSIAETLVLARLLMLQSKRLILATLERRLHQQQVDSLSARVEHMRREAREAHERYNMSMLAFGSPAIPDYWPVAYGLLIETADRLSDKLRRTAPNLPSADRYQLATDVEMLEGLVEGWRSAIRASMASVAQSA
jgi:hypothetical protein